MDENELKEEKKDYFDKILDDMEIRSGSEEDDDNKEKTENESSIPGIIEAKEEFERLIDEMEIEKEDEDKNVKKEIKERINLDEVGNKQIVDFLVLHQILGKDGISLLKSIKDNINGLKFLIENKGNIEQLLSEDSLNLLNDIREIIAKEKYINSIEDIIKDRERDIEKKELFLFEYGDRLFGITHTNVKKYYQVDGLRFYDYQDDSVRVKDLDVPLIRLENIFIINKNKDDKMYLIFVYTKDARYALLPANTIFEDLNEVDVLLLDENNKYIESVGLFESKLLFNINIEEVIPD